MLEKTSNKKLSDFLDRFGSALATRDIETAMSLFQDDCYWRDLVTFTWNIKTLEGKDDIRDMLTSQLDVAKPSGWTIAEGEDAVEADGLLEGWISFETKVARGFGHIRLKNGLIWTLLTSMVELKGHEEPLGSARPLGIPDRPEKEGRTWKEEREAEAAELGHSRQPYCLIIGGGQGAIGLGARLKQLGVPTIIVASAPATAGANATSLSACTTRSGTTTCPICRSPGIGRCFHPRTRSATGWKCTPRSWS